MNSIKRIFGIVWLALAIAMGYFMATFGWEKFSSGKQDGIVFGIIILFVLLPLLVLGLGTFGIYALKGEYDDED